MASAALASEGHHDDRLDLVVADRAPGARPDDLLDQFMHFSVDGNSLDDNAIVKIMHMFTIAGLDTVTSSLSCVIAWFATHPEHRRSVVQDPSGLATAIEEIMRFESPVPSGGARWASQDTELTASAIKKGELVFSAGAQRTSIRRHSTSRSRRISGAPTIAISHLPRGSTGASLALARAELRSAVDQLHRRIPDYWVADGDAIEYEFVGVRQAKVLPLGFRSAQ